MSPFLVSSIIILLPISLNLDLFGLSGVDLVPSDVLLLGFPAAFIHVQRMNLDTSQRRLLSFCAAGFVFFLMVGVAGSLGSSSPANLLSALKFSKFLLFVHLGVYIASISKHRINPLTLVRLIAALVLIVVVSDSLYNPGWPRPRWGEYFFNIPIYGYPNSSAYFFCCLFAATTVYIYATGSNRLSYFLYPTAICAALLAALSLSRNATLGIVAVIFILPLVSRKLNVKQSTVLLCVLICAFYILLFYFDDILSTLQLRVDKTLLQLRLNSYSGRSQIWNDTLALWIERPLFGFHFESYSNYSSFGTPHQQYLETLFKAGAIGAIVYLLPYISALIIMVSYCRRAKTSHNKVSTYFSTLSATILLVTIISNFFQPNLTYSVTGNFVFFLIGLAIYEQTANRRLREEISISKYRNKQKYQYHGSR